jgi:hypothetical protein
MVKAVLCLSSDRSSERTHLMTRPGERGRLTPGSVSAAGHKATG